MAAVWRLARDVSELLAGLPWVLVGGLMVQLHEAEAGRNSAFATGDVDAVLDVRALSTATTDGASRLLAAGFEAVPEDERVIYRFRRRTDIVDLLAPDHLGARAAASRRVEWRPAHPAHDTWGRSRALRRIADPSASSAQLIARRRK